MNSEEAQTERDLGFMERALALAETAASRGQRPFGAIVVDPEGRIVGEGHNTVYADYDPTAHGEVAAIRDAWRRLGSWDALAGCTLYTSCEPCLICSSVIVDSGLGRVVFAAEDTDVPTNRPLLDAALSEAAAWLNAQPDRAPLAVVGGVLGARGRAILEAFVWDRAGGAG